MKTYIPKQTRPIFPILLEFKEKLRKEYGDRFLQMILYGSYSRGTAKQDSDIDLLIVLSEMSSPFEEIEKLTEIKYGLMLKHDILLSTNPVDKKTISHSLLPIYKNIMKEGIAV